MSRTLSSSAMSAPKVTDFSLIFYFCFISAFVAFLESYSIIGCSNVLHSSFLSLVPHVTLEQSETCFRSFLVATNAVCEHSNVQCVVTDPSTGSQFDLSPLQKDLGNWEIAGLNHTKYLLNVCRSIVQTPEADKTSCSTAASVCKISQNARS